jgi:hypothetical protein
VTREDDDAPESWAWIEDLAWSLLQAVAGLGALALILSLIFVWLYRAHAPL